MAWLASVQETGAGWKGDCMFENILVAVDGSELSMDAARRAGDLARQMKAKVLRVVVVLESIPARVGNPNWERESDERLKEAQGVLQRACESVGDIPGLLHCELTEGPPAEAISSVARMRDCSLIVMASRGPDEIAELVLEGNGRRAGRDAPCPILVVR
jgi:nucleotide-binding universal stress UspA family protein